MGVFRALDWLICLDVHSIVLELTSSNEDVENKILSI